MDSLDCQHKLTSIFFGDKKEDFQGRILRHFLLKRFMSELFWIFLFCLRAPRAGGVLWTKERFHDLKWHLHGT